MWPVPFTNEIVLLGKTISLLSFVGGQMNILSLYYMFDRIYHCVISEDLNKVQLKDYVNNKK